MVRMPIVIRMLGLGGVALLLAMAAMSASASVPGGPRLAVQKLDRDASTLQIETASQSGGRQQVVVGGPRRTTRPLPEFGFAPSWSPDGTRLVFGGHVGDGTRLFLVPADGGRPRVIPRTRGAFAPVFAPDGSTVAFARARVRSHIGLPNHGPPNIWSYASVTTWTIEIDGSSPHRLTQWRNGLEIVPSSFSPDGSVLAASEADEGESDVEYNAVALQVDGSSSSLISSDASWPSFSPDGSQIALIARLAHTEPHRGRYGFYRGAVTVMQADHTEPRHLARTSFYEQSPPSWDPSGERLAYTEATTAMEINVDGSCRTKVLLGKKELLYFGPVWQPGPGREAGRIEC
jgi:Tol biopolymer transport system component